MTPSVVVRDPRRSQESENEIREPATKRLDPDSKLPGNIIEASLTRAFP